MSLSYWATVLQLRKNRGLEPGTTAAWREELDLDAVLEGGSPTTIFYILQLLEHVGLPSDPDVSSTWIATTSRADSRVPDPADAVRAFHEIVPATGLGRTPTSVFSAAELEFVRARSPELIRVAREVEDTDAAAEALITAALLGETESATYQDAIEWLLSQQRPDGTFQAARDRTRPRTVNGDRHGVLVGSWALLTALGGTEPMVLPAP